ncbi:MAG: hypothetical protein JXD23_14530, partial [Spirochaetales bacterium]|nr:hypothetical protein [Spirochaetales bacterium]
YLQVLPINTRQMLATFIQIRLAACAECRINANEKKLIELFSYGATERKIFPYINKHMENIENWLTQNELSDEQLLPVTYLYYVRFVALSASSVPSV